jgi:hypothetical protein
MPGFFTTPEDDDLDAESVQNAFDWIQLKRVDDALLCPVCSGNVWGYAGRVGVTTEATAFASKKQRRLVQIVCRNCEYVMLFSDRILKGPLDPE